jgi:drug/metabolite transporter (DMT)-like permease
MESFSATVERPLHTREEMLAYVGLSATTLAWAGAFVAGKVVLAEMTPLPAAAWRYAIAALALLPFVMRHRSGIDVASAIVPLTVMVVCGGILYPWLFLMALARTSATNTALLIAVNPVLTLLLAPLVGEALNRHRIGGICLALLGAATVITKGDPHQVAELSFNSGDLLALAAAIGWASFNLASRRAVGRLSPSRINFVVYGLGGVGLFGLGWAEDPLGQLSQASAAAIAGLLLMGLISSVVAGQLFLIGMRTLGVSRTVVFIYLVPLLTAALSAMLLGERFEISQAAGGAAVLAGVYWTTR